MTELSVEADPRLWSVVPGDDDVETWVRGLLADRPDEQAAHILVAAEIAVTARDAADGGLVLLLCEPQSGLYGTLILMATDVPPITDAARAEQLALTITPSEWPPTTSPIVVQNEPGWRISVLMPASDDDAGDTPTTLSFARTTYVFALDGALAVAQLSPLPVEAAAVAMALTERMLPTIGLSHDV